MPGGSDPSYMREYREDNPAYAERNRNRTLARRRAHTVLANERPVEFARLYQVPTMPEDATPADRNRIRNEARRVAQLKLANKHPVQFERLFSAQIAAMRGKGLDV